MVRPVAEEYFSNGLDKEVLYKLIKLSSRNTINEFSLSHKIEK